MTLTLRRGLPRIAGGDPFPPGGTVVAPLIDEPQPVAEPAPTPAPAQTGGESVTLRRGLPRVAGGQAWPTVETALIGGVPAPEAVSEPAPTPAAVPAAAPTATESIALRQGLPRRAGGPAWPESAQVDVAVAAPVPEPEAPVVEEPVAVDKPAAAQPAAPRRTPETKPEPQKYGPFTVAQWTAVAGGGIVLLGLLLAGAVALTRWFLGTDTGSSFIATYDGHAPMPESAPVGVPGWLAWTHFFNVFLMALIIKSGLQIRHERRPDAYWTPRGGGKKISLSVWLHQSLDILWVVNGAIFLVLLFVTGQWMKIVPTSWEVVPNALSAGLQYLSLDWPTENGWVHYNGLQQITYFLVVFVAAPIAVATGVRMSEFWAKAPASWSKVYPVEIARKLHFPTMLFFSAFIVMHVALVFATGVLRNLNHMFAAQGSTDPAEYASNWTGFLIFLVAMSVTAGAVVAARPMVLTPIARRFGEVTAR